MKLFIQLAIRNVHRNFRSALLHGTGVSISVILLLFAFALSRGIEKQIVDRRIRFDTGAVYIEFEKEIANQRNAPDGDALFQLIRSALAAIPEITGYRNRIYPSHSVLYNETNANERIKLQGIHPEELTLLLDMVPVKEGIFLTEENPKSILVSNGLAASLELAIGSSCPILQQTIDGMINLDEYTVTGIFQYNSLANKNLVYMDYEEARKLYHCNLPSALLLDLDDPAHAGPVKDKLTGLLSGVNENSSIKIGAYTDHTGTARAVASINKYGFIGLATFLILISFVGFCSMQSENIQERKKEIGTLLSFGFKKSAVKKIFLLESIYISLLFMAAGSIFLTLNIMIINLNNGLFLGESASFAFGNAVINPQMALEDFLPAIGVTVAYPFIATYLSLIAINKDSITSLLRPTC